VGGGRPVGRDGAPGSRGCSVADPLHLSATHSLGRRSGGGGGGDDFGGAGADWVGAGTGADDAGQLRKARAIDAGLARHASPKGMAALLAFGGREQAAICGAVLAARSHRIPVILDGFICTAAAAPLFSHSPDLLDHCLIGHLSAERGHQKLLSAMGKTAVLEFDMRLGEGSGAALALGILRSALACHNGMATFGEAGVSGG
ncbi:MAG: nicotinate-nucleotide--dimethylbenzimidazole phosphoribosyltransferase, partial [Cypionkella sp.]